jgi:pyruvate, water dikinase
VVGTGNATAVLHDGEQVTVSCAEGETGVVYDGILPFETKELDVPRSLPSTRTQVMLNLANPGQALRWWRLPVDGVGLARMEFIINQRDQGAPHGAPAPDRTEDADPPQAIAELTRGYAGRRRVLRRPPGRGRRPIAAPSTRSR